ncbi:hypothetical protein HPP92_004437 [Vanilla planifolia]|uniref:Uncharacterized protein n=1 Tax=Vanilla planifolia TaxID=51239 RepID=A0A835RWS0_VANPL|nr:hypothetical protein HPP92_004437 [Vanilla planifolia]
MTSSFVQIDDDDFDWEAAVFEIDFACQSATPDASDVGNVIPITPLPSTGGFCPSEARQSTLDRFVINFTKRRGIINNQSEAFPQEFIAGAFGKENDPFHAGDEAQTVSIDLEAAKTWIYPLNVPLRGYQLAITKSSLFSNTLVALPTGLGKTLIAAVVMYNYFRWFPQGKIVFAAPSRPLVMQQIEACHNIVGIPQEWTIDMTGRMNPRKRLKFWKAKRVFFVTPQVLEKDIQSGICLVKQLICLVIDEAHRALGNYSYTVAVRELMAMSLQLRILGLTATPGSKHQTIQNVIDNLYISTLEYRHESDLDVSPYVHNRKIELVEVPMGDDAVGIDNLLMQAIQPIVASLSAIGVIPQRALNLQELLNIKDKFCKSPPDSPPISGEVVKRIIDLITFCHIRRLLSIHGIRPAYEMLSKKLNQGWLAKRGLTTEALWEAKRLMQKSLSGGVPTPKLAKMLEILVDHFRTKGTSGSRVIIFSSFRESVSDIMDSLSTIGDMVKATKFIGQSSGKSLKGQSQKVQQSILQQFRSGRFNVIVATSIGEEGLDIMEVDLVVCFDANVSPLRMIQRMGRTGRKNDGRVDILSTQCFLTWLQF